MFTGIVEVLGTVGKFERKDKDSSILVLHVPAVMARLKVGASLSVSGACLTLIRRKGEALYFNVVRETKERTTLKNLKSGDRVNLERPLKWNGRIDGHFVLGHVDGVGIVKKLMETGREKSFLIQCPPGLQPLILEKGSVAVDGVSLTVGKVSRRGFWVHCIPHTLKYTTLRALKLNDKVNLETDILMKRAASRL